MKPRASYSFRTLIGMVTEMNANYVQRLRIEFVKDGPTRYIGHLDLAKSLERSLNRARIPLAYTQGYNRRPRLQLTTALPLGYTSECEIADIWLVEAIDPIEAINSMASTMAPGIQIISVKEVELRAPTPQAQEAEYRITFLERQEPADLQSRIDRLLEAQKLKRERRGKVYDLRPLILGLELLNIPGIPEQLRMQLSLLPGKTGRPDEVLAEMGLDPLESRIHRSNLVLVDSA
jgi:radical SAM-linked protein